MSGICSKHKHHEPGCRICEAIPAASACNDWLSCIFALANAISEADSIIQVVKNQEDATADNQPDAATFLKVSGARIGRDLELYNFMAEFEGKPAVTVRILEEIVLPIKTISPEAFKVGISHLLAFNVFGDKQEEWAKLLHSFEG